MKTLHPALLLGLAGWVAGAATGVAAFGTAISGAFVFGPIAMFAGWLISRKPADSAPSTSQPDTPPGADSPLGNGLSDEFDALSRDTVSLLGEVGWLFARLWNLFAHSLKHLGLLIYCERQPWLLLVAGLLLLIVFLPIGILFAVTYLAAHHYGASAQNHFLASKRGAMAAPQR